MPYRVAVSVRNRLYDFGVCRTHALPIPSICVGNLTAGGTGKTPTVAWVADHLRGRGRRVAIIRRGYRRGDADGPSDETILLRDRLGDVDVIESPDRVAGARDAASRGADVVVLDDGFQHRRAARDLDLVLVDAGDPFGGGHLLPWGYLREPIDALRRAGAIVITRADQVPRETLERLVATLERRVPSTPIAQAVHAPRRLVEVGPGGRTRRHALLDLVGREVRAFSGVGRPAAFRRTLEDLGATVVDEAHFPDHHDYATSDLTGLPGGDAPWITTEKDWVKIRRLEGVDVPIWFLGIDLEIVAGRDALLERIDAVVDASSSG